jgi:hypothetical protein
MGSTPMGGSYAPIRTAQFNFTHQDHPVCHILPGSSGRGASSGSRHGVRDRVVAFELAARKLEPVITLRCGATPGAIATPVRTVRQFTARSGQPGCDGSEVQYSDFLVPRLGCGRLTASSRALQRHSGWGQSSPCAAAPRCNCNATTHRAPVHG